MKQYIGTKMIQAEPARGGNGEMGYKVRYADGYESWSPKKVFEKAYRPTDCMNFGLAIEAMKAGKRVRRNGWNGKGMWIAISPGYKGLDAAHVWNEHNKEAAIQNGGTIDIPPYVTMKTADNKIVCGWLASQTDMLADDWEIVE